MPRGVFIVLEGCDGSGKSTQLRHLVDRLQARGYSTYATAEPTRSAVGELLRQGLSAALAFDRETMALLFASDRRHHVANEIRPALDRGEIVVCDRYDLSNVVYRAAEQPVVRCTACGGSSDGAPWLNFAALGVKCPCCPACGLRDKLSWPRSDAVAWARALSLGLPRPDLTIVLDLPLELAGARRAARGGKAERYDDPVMQERAIELYRRASQLLPGERIALVNGDQAEAVVADDIWKAITAAEVLP